MSVASVARQIVSLKKRNSIMQIEFRTQVGMLIGMLLSVSLLAQTPSPIVIQGKPLPMFLGNIVRPLRYTPEGTDFVITNGAEYFNRPLYGSSSPFRVDGGDVPEFSLYLPGRGGNLRLGIQTGTGTKWLNNAKEIVARYRPGAMIYDIRDPLLSDVTLHLEALSTRTAEGFLLKAELRGTNFLHPVNLVFAFGGVNGMRGQRNGDIGCESKPVSEFFQLQPEQCRGNTFELSSNSFVVRGKPGLVGGVMSDNTSLVLADASNWSDAEKLFASGRRATAFAEPVVIGKLKLLANEPEFLGLQRLASSNDLDKPSGQWPSARLARLFAQEEKMRQAIAERVVVQTPDPYINAAAAALNIAADAVWDDKQKSYLHGGVAWRVRLLGWRVSYAGDELGWHDRTAEHFAGFVAQQNTNLVPAEIPAPEESANLSRNETALHSNGDLTKTHYDMNLVGVDAFFRHLLWTGDLNYARQMWPAIERHLAWERRLFRREFGAGKLPLYEAYCCIWASDDLAYNGGGATHSSAYNYFENHMAARVAKLLGKDPAPYEQEAELIARGMRENLWLPDRGWFGEWKDLLGLQLVHPNAAAWTFYHTVDSEVPSSLEAWEMSRFVDTQIARIPVEGPGVPGGNFTMPTTSWMPYTWSLNNVVMAESTHTALAYWQAGRLEVALPLFKGALLDSMYLGLCPGNVGMCTWYDVNRQESQRDFGDGIGATSRALIEGLFGVQPDLLAGEMIIHPGFPSGWNDASIRHPDFNFAFHRDGLHETYDLETKKLLKLRLEIPALRDAVAGVTVNGKPANWRPLENSVGMPQMEIATDTATKQMVVVEWKGRTPVAAETEQVVESGMMLRASCGARIVKLADPQGALSEAKFTGDSLQGVATGTVGHRTVFAEVEQGTLRWWQPVSFEIKPVPELATPMNWKKPVNGKMETVDLTAAFNDKVTQIFKNNYRTPRSPFCSLAAPKQGIGSWCHPNEEFDMDDSGLRTKAAGNGGKIVLPDGIPLATPGDPTAKNIAFVSQWDNYPREISVPLHGQSSHAFLLMAGSTDAMQSRFDNGEVIVTYADGSMSRLALRNPTTWWPIDQDYFIDDFAFRRPEPLPPRVDLKTGRVRVLEMAEFKGSGKTVPGGAATVLDLPLDTNKQLKSLAVRAIANEVVIGLMSVTLER